MVYFQTENPNSGKFWRALKYVFLEYFMAIWDILRPFGVFYGHFGHLVVIWYILLRFGLFYQEKIWQPWNGPSKNSIDCVGVKAGTKRRLKNSIRKNSNLASRDFSDHQCDQKVM
jgi:hypothetical protein